MIPNDNAMVGVVIFALGVLAIVVWSVVWWRELRPQLFPNSAKQAKPIAEQQTAPFLIRCAPNLISSAAAMFEREDSALARSGAEALRKLLTSLEITTAIDNLMMESCESASIESLLLRKEGSYVYVLLIPNRHEHAHLLRRYAPFTAGWRRHFELVRASLMASGGFTNMAAILLFLNPEKKESVLQVSCCNAQSVLIPSRLAERPDLNQAGVTVLDSSLEFNLTV